eukprot:m.248165 g.248165  ORF g.248165 m.248165 type:complete len:903 (-) comp15649_c0_seq1:81-2789(-)
MMLTVVLVVLPLLAGPAAARTAVFTADLQIGMFTVYDDDSYELAVQGQVWLKNSTTGLAINGTWWTTTAPSTGPPGTCTFEQDIDYAGNDLYFIDDTTGGDACCKACMGEPRCTAWSWTNVTFAATRDSSVPWANRCYLKTSTAGRKPYPGHVSGTRTVSQQRLARTGADAGQGTDRFGNYRSWSIYYRAATTPVTFSFLYYPALAAVGFRQTYPQGATAINITTPVNQSAAGGLTEFASSMLPAAMFPSFTAGSSFGNFGTATWVGRFAHTQTATGLDACAALAQAGGAEGGPLVLYNNTPDVVADVLVWAPVDHFKATILGQIAPVAGASCGASAGMGGYVTALPAGYTAGTLIYLNKSGINGVMQEWGALMRAAYGKPSITPDPSAEYLTYWTDNGAYYDFYAYEPDINSKGLVEDILVDLYNTFRNGTYPGPALPVHNFMLDAYWMYNIRPNCNCKINDTAWPVPFPSGLPWLVEQLGNTKLILYNGPQCADTTYAGTWPLVYSLYQDVGWAKGVLSLPSGEASYGFYSWLFDTLKPVMESFTQDFLDFNYLLFPAWLADSDGNHAWLEGQARAALEHNMTVQYCMALPGDFLDALNYPAVTNARATDDYGAGGDNWKIGGTSLLLSAVGIRASKDNFWSGSQPTDRGHETSPFLQAVVCALSSGPVGFADALFHTNPAVLWPTMAADGRLLHALIPAATIDAQLANRPAWRASDARAAFANTINGHFPVHSVLVTGVAAPSAASLLSVHDLWPAPNPSAPYFLWQYNNSACATDGGPASDCLIALSTVSHAATDPSTLMAGSAHPAAVGSMSGDLVPWTLWTAVPQIGQYVLLGELGKYVALSPQRFTAITITETAIVAELTGAPHEAVRLAYAAGSTIRVAVAVMDASGHGTAKLW